MLFPLHAPNKLAHKCFHFSTMKKLICIVRVQGNERQSVRLTGRRRKLRCSSAPGAMSESRRLWLKTSETGMSSNTSQLAWVKWVSLGVPTSAGFESKLSRLTTWEPNCREAWTARSRALLNTLPRWMRCWAEGQGEGKEGLILFHTNGCQRATLTPLMGQGVLPRI